MDKTENSREEKGKEIAEKHDQIKRIDNNWYQVKAQSLSYESWYDVIATKAGFVCDCPDCQQRKIKCKHIHAVEFSIKLREQVQKKDVVIEEMPYDKCPQCQSINIVKHGIRHNRTYDLQRYSCKDCKNRFSFNLGFEKMKASPKIITSAMQLYFTGESLRNVQQFLRLQGVNVVHSTVYSWINKYTGLMEKYLENITPQVGEKWRADELYLKVKGHPKYLYALMDDDTRFWIAQQVSDNKYNDDISQMLRDGKKIAGKKPSVLITDGARNFQDAWKKEYRSKNFLDKKTEHIRHIHFDGNKNNNKMERMNGEIRDREKVVRGLKKDDSPLINGYQIFHNYIRPHQGLEGKTPSEACGITIKGIDKWKTLIQQASRKA